MSVGFEEFSGRRRSRIEGTFEGYDEGHVYVLDDGSRWRQTGFQYSYQYLYRPRVKVKEGNRCLLWVEGMAQSVEVDAL